MNLDENVIAQGGGGGGAGGDPAYLGTCLKIAARNKVTNGPGDIVGCTTAALSALKVPSIPGNVGTPLLVAKLLADTAADRFLKDSLTISPGAEISPTPLAGTREKFQQISTKFLKLPGDFLRSSIDKIPSIPSPRSLSKLPGMVLKLLAKLIGK